MTRAALALLFLAAFGPPVRGAESATQKPNVLLILADDLGFSDLGSYGGEIDTPNLDALAKNGLRFTQFYNTARCWPTRGSILTGYYAQQIRRDTVPGVPSGNQGTRPAWAKLLPELIEPHGYVSYHSGKWHVDGLPLKNGFTHSYSLNDHDRHFAPKKHTEDDKQLPAADPKEGYYSSTAIADYAIKQLTGHFEKHPTKPFFEFVAFTAPHFPVQAPAADVAKYRKKYLAGWDELREARWKRMKGLGLGDTLPPIERDLGPPYAFPEAIKKLGPNELNRPLAWKDLTAEQKAFQADKMAVHAAMVDRMDREIGRILDVLKKAKQFDNTLVVFLSDNGASAEIMVRGDGHDPHAECGTGATFLSIGPGWSILCNTPFRRHKTWVHEGGIHTPLIAHWPNGINAKGELRATPGHVADVVPTVLELAAGKLVTAPAGGGPDFAGRSLVPAFAKNGTVQRGSLWWQHEGNRALRVGDFKIVAAGKDAEWELYDLKADPTETKNIANEKPEKVRELAAAWQKEAETYYALAKKDAAPAKTNTPPAKKSKQPNVLFIAVDDLNHWVGHLGRNKQTKTPNIDRLAKMGVTFTHAYCAAPVCNPSRAALMSGLRPGSTGVYDNGQNWRPVIGKELTLTTQFLNAGYNVYGTGKIYHANVHRDGEWTDYFVGGKEKTTPHPDSKDDGVGGIKFRPLTDDSKLPDESIVDYGIKQLQSKHEKPFFLAVGLHKPHMPWNVPKKYYDLFPLDQIELPPTQKDDLKDVPAGGLKMAKADGDHATMVKSGRWKEAVQGYLATIAYCDAQIGRLLDAYDKSPAKEETIIVFWGDHGWHLGEKEHWRKFALWEEATRMPYIWVAPGVTTPGGVCDRTVDLMSVYPTLCGLCAVAKPKHVEGEDLLPLLRDPRAKWERPAVTTFHLNNHAVRTDRWRYIRYADGGEELYDHTKDPYEWTNVARDAKFADVKQELMKLLPTTNRPELPRNKE
ncbi:sulfatase-like hydrolase/transferase [Gemmata sp. JC717]|uniref:sulfatase-like hydrolase/transferase n=1 Tax=Gemmata algarum TaxID=2975278 RepID=UPI0021BB94F7|nr:sulfatase-like hydrolase/transferase [Gemmata algarum]MDY3555165.1 sulfatase-like hydrolase/transferase [Gemmata algarum]